MRWLSRLAKVYRRRRIWRVRGTDVESGDEELDKQLLVGKFMVVQEKGCKRVERRQLQSARASRGVALAVDQGSALGVQAGRELDNLETKKRSC